jgi:transposase
MALFRLSDEAGAAVEPHLPEEQQGVRRWTTYDADRLRSSLSEEGAAPVIRGRCNRKRTVRYNEDRYRGRHLIETAVCRPQDFLRAATATTHWPATSSQAWRTQPPSPSGCV